MRTEHEEIRTLSSSLTERNPKVFEPLLFSWNFVEDHVKNNKITGTWVETVDIFNRHRSSSDLFAPSHRRRKNGIPLSRL